MMNSIALDSVLTYMSTTYNKILLADFERDTFLLVKADTEEVRRIPTTISLSQWISDFVNSPYCHKDDILNFIKFFDFKKLKSAQRALRLEYRKLIDGRYKRMEMKVLPLGANKSYIMIQDLSMLYGDEEDNE